MPSKDKDTWIEQDHEAELESDIQPKKILETKLLSIQVRPFGLLTIAC